MYLLRGFVDFLTIVFRRPKFFLMVCLIVGACLLLTALYNARVVTEIPVYVVDHDNSTISRTMRTYLAAGQDLKVLGTLNTPEEAQEALESGQAAAVVYIPNGLSTAVKTQSGGHVVAYIDGSNILVARNADKAIQTVVKSTSVGIAMVTLQKGGMPDFELLGALQPINLDIDRPFNALTSYSDYLLPVFLFFNLSLFAILMTAACFQVPLPETVQKHTIRRRWYYFGRLAAVFIMSVFGGIILYQWGLPRVDIVLQATPLMALSALFIFIFLTQLLYTDFHLVLPLPVAMSASCLIGMLSVMFSGLTWPLEMMPWYIHGLATWIPLTPFLQSLQVYLYHDANWGDLSEFYMMFLKQALLYGILAFCIMRAKDLRLLIKWLIKRKKAITDPNAPQYLSQSIEMPGAQSVQDMIPATETASLAPSGSTATVLPPQSSEAPMESAIKIDEKLADPTAAELLSNAQDVEQDIPNDTDNNSLSAQSPHQPETDNSEAEAQP